MLSNANNVDASGRKVQCRMVSNGMTLSGIISVSYSTDWSGEITIGQCVGSSIHVTMKNPPSSLSGQPIVLSMGVGSPVTWTTIGTFYVDPSTYTSRLGQTRFAAYDKMRNGTRIFDASGLAESTTLQAVFNAACTQGGFTSFTIASQSVSRDDVTGYTIRDIIGFCASYNGKNAYINASGNLEFRWFNSTPCWTAGRTNANVPSANTSTISVSRLICNGKENVLTAGSGNAIYFSNPVMTQARLNSLVSSVGMTYNTADVSIPYGNFLLESGKDTISVASNTTDTSYVTVPIMDLGWKYDGGLSSTCRSFGAATYDGAADNAIRSSSFRRIDSVIQRKRDSSKVGTTVQQAVEHATQQITGAAGGYIRINYGGDGKTAELLVMDTPDIATATKVGRLNGGGFGYSSTGYNGEYETAITADGWIVADRIAGNQISGVSFRADGGSGQNSWHMVLENGALKVIDANNNEVGRITFLSYQGRNALYISGNVIFYGSQSNMKLINPWYSLDGEEYTSLCGKIAELEQRISDLEGG